MVQTQFTLRMRRENRALLETIQGRLGAGRVYPARASASQPYVRLQITSSRECWRLIAVLDEYPLRSSKREEYKIWREAAALIFERGSAKMCPELEALKDRLEEARWFGGEDIEITKSTE